MVTMRIFQTHIVLTTALLTLSGPILAAELTGRVISVSDGDSLTLLVDDRQQVKVRLAEIDSPESGQAYGNKSKQILTELIHGKEVIVVVQDTDRYGRTVGRLYVGDLDVSAEMVRTGAAWVYREYVIDAGLFAIEENAKNAKRGLWGLSEAQQTAPWNWRRGVDNAGYAATDRDDGCVVKGNINSKGDKIYHGPGSGSYSATRIDESKGERWFCSEQDAQRAGWRPRR